MPDAVLNCSRDEAREKVGKAMNRVDGISKVDRRRHQVIGKTGLSFPRVLWSWGETIYVDILESDKVTETPIGVRGEKNVPINIGANPDKFRRRFLNELDKLRGSYSSGSSNGKMVNGIDMTRASELKGEGES